MCAQVHKQNRYTIHTCHTQRYHTTHSQCTHRHNTHKRVRCTHVLRHNAHMCTPASLHQPHRLQHLSCSVLPLPVLLTLQCLSNAHSAPHPLSLDHHRPHRSLLAFPLTLQARVFIPLNFNQDERVRMRSYLSCRLKSSASPQGHSANKGRMGIQAQPVYPRTCALLPHTQGPDHPVVNSKPQLIGHPVYLPASLMAELQLP